jgi:hypothetical protein
MRLVAKIALTGAGLMAMGVASAQEQGPTRDPWLDRVQRGVHDSVWRSAMLIDHLFGAQYEGDVYRKGVTGSVAPSLLWDEFNGFKPRFRFNLTVPLPQLNDRFNAFIGRVDPDEYVTERSPESGAIRRQFGPPTDDHTIFGISYRAPPKQGWRFDADTGVELGSALDPYVKGGYIFQHGAVEDLLFSFRQTAFWQESEGLGTTSRIGFERLFEGPWLLRTTASGTISEKSEGVRGYGSIMALRGIPDRKAFAVAVGFSGEMDADVPLQDYGIKVAWRQSVRREWLVLELRTSLAWPKEELGQPRAPSWGVGIGFEMFIGTDEFLARPVTF